MVSIELALTRELKKLPLELDDDNVILTGFNVEY